MRRATLIQLKQYEIAPSVAQSFVWDVESLWARPDWRVQVQEATLQGFRQVADELELDEEFFDRDTPETIDIPGLQQLADQIREELQHGSGVVWLQGFPAADFTLCR